MGPQMWLVPGMKATEKGAGRRTSLIFSFLPAFHPDIRIDTIKKAGSLAFLYCWQKNCASIWLKLTSLRNGDELAANTQLTWRGFVGLLGLFAGLCTTLVLIVTAAEGWQEHVHARWSLAAARVENCYLMRRARIDRNTTTSTAA